MATYTNDLRLKEIATGDEDGTWGTSTNTNLSLIADAFSLGTKQMAANANETFTMPDATADGTRSLYLKITSAVSLTATRTVTLAPNTVSKVWIIENATTGSQSITIAQGSGGTVTIPNGQVKAVYTDGAGAGGAVVDALVDLALNSPVLTTPNLGTPSAAVLTNATGLPISTGVSGLGTGVATFLATPSSTNLAAAVTGETGSGALVFATSPTLTTPNLGTPSAATLTNATGLPISTGVSGLGTGVATFLATPSSANLAAAVTNETGSGALVFATSPTLVTPALGTPSSATLTNATGLPIVAGTTGTLSVARGGTGATTLTANNVILGNGTSAVQFVAPGTSGNVLTSNGTTWASAAVPAGGLTYLYKTSNYTAADKEGVLADTTGGAFTVTLPATPATGAQVVVADAGGNWGTNNLTVGRNGSTISGLAQDLVCDIAGASVQLVYDGSTWEVYAQIGGNGGTAVTLDGVQTLTNKTINGSSNTITNISLSTGVTSTLPVANGGTGATTLTANNVILGNGTSAVQVVAPGSSGNVLTSDGTTWQSTAPAAAGFTLGTPITTTSGTVAEFTGIPAGVKQIIISFNSVSTTTAGQSWWVQLGTSGSYVTSGYEGGVFGAYNTPVGTYEPTDRAGIMITDSATSAEKYSGSVIWTLLNSSTNLWCWNGNVKSDQGPVSVSAGRVTLTNAITRLKIASQSSYTFDSGSINIMYI